LNANRILDLQSRFNDLAEEFPVLFDIYDRLVFALFCHFTEVAAAASSCRAELVQRLALGIDQIAIGIHDIHVGSALHSLAYHLAALFLVFQ